jgi:PAS domain S-box-containing protein
MLVLPLRLHAAMTGSLVCYFHQPRAFTGNEIAVANTLGDLASAAITTTELLGRQRDLLVEREQRASALESLNQRMVAHQDALRRSEERYRTLASAGTSVMSVGTIDATGATIEHSPSWQALTGQTFQETQRLGWLQAVHPNDRERAKEEHANGLAAGQPHQVEYRVRLADGTFKWFAAKRVPVLESDGTIREWIGTFTDIDQRKSTEEHLRFLAYAEKLFASSLDYETTLTHLTQAAVPALADWCVVNIADDSERGYHRLAVGHVDPSKIRLAEELQERFPPDPSIDSVARVLRTGASELFPEIPEELLREIAQTDEHLEIIRELGLLSGMVIPLPGRLSPAGTITFVSSDSKRKFTPLDLQHAEEFARRAAVAVENAELYRTLQQANRAKDDFLAMLSHEMRTPMTSILGWSRILHDGGVDAETQKTALDAILRSAQAQASLIEDVLDMSRIISGKLQLDPQPVDLASISHAAAKTLQPAADAKGVAVIIDRRPGSMLVTGDGHRLQQVIWNLISNAIKFTQRDGEVRVRLENADSVVRLIVSDNGKGIEPEFLPFIFEPFRQAENVTTRSHGGLGLGLAIVKYLVELHGGSVLAESQGPTLGAAFTVELPLRAIRQAPRGKAKGTSSQAAISHVSNDGTLAGKRILHVDDQADARVLVSAILERRGARVTGVASVREAETFLAAQEIDLLISDIAMPERDGFELMRSIRAGRNLVPAIALTAFGREGEEEKMRGAGFSSYLRKPIEPAALVREIHRLLAETKGSTPPN